MGVDLSPAMLDRAAAIDDPPSLVEADAASWRPQAPVDLIIANAALQLVAGHERLMPDLLHHCRVLAVQVPDNFDAPSHRLLARDHGGRAMGGAVGRSNPRRPGTYAGSATWLYCATWGRRWICGGPPTIQHSPARMRCWTGCGAQRCCRSNRRSAAPAARATLAFEAAAGRAAARRIPYRTPREWSCSRSAACFSSPRFPSSGLPATGLAFDGCVKCPIASTVALPMQRAGSDARARCRTWAAALRGDERAMKIGIPKERRDDERRAAASADTVKRYKGLGAGARGRGRCRRGGCGCRPGVRRRRRRDRLGRRRPGTPTLSSRCSGRPTTRWAG